MSGGIDPYKILGVTSEATFEEVRQAYRRAATKYHPDRGGDAWVFQQVQQAFAILRAQFEGESSDANSNTRSSSQEQSTDTNSQSRNGSRSSRQSDSTFNQQSASQRATNPSGGNQPGHNQVDRNQSGANQPGTKQHGSTAGSQTKNDQAGNASKLSYIQGWLSGNNFELRDETSYFVLANFMDLVMTGILMRFHAVEANPIAAAIYHHFGFAGMIGLKVASVAIVCLLAQLVARRNLWKGKLLMIGGTVVVSAVVVYSMFLARRLIHLVNCDHAAAVAQIVPPICEPQSSW